MKNTLLTLAVSGAMFCFGCDGNTGTVNAVPTPNATPIASPMATQPVPVSTQPRNGNYPGLGVVTKINMQLGSIELNHEEIVGMMPPMIMEFYVGDMAILDGIAVGDKVEFVLEYKHPSETIVSVKKIK